MIVKYHQYPQATFNYAVTSPSTSTVLYSIVVIYHYDSHSQYVTFVWSKYYSHRHGFKTYLRILCSDGTTFEYNPIDQKIVVDYRYNGPLYEVGSGMEIVVISALTE